MQLNEIGNGGLSAFEAKYFYARIKYIISDQTGEEGISLVIFAPAAGLWLGSGISLFLCLPSFFALRPSFNGASSL